ncbi:hypothetical protein NDU88_002104 [Pleurodeles waltl]|uniref:GIY-YIG domain-containing protein n=1 Tax=Pleurodeles waltl TaxID=8319 RepID=A0AAV7KUL5_PLEWA|nr:hypothetical protein NDU88_002104 [Pleurodeles waltl]
MDLQKRSPRISSSREKAVVAQTGSSNRSADLGEGLRPLGTTALYPYCANHNYGKIFLPQAYNEIKCLTLGCLTPRWLRWCPGRTAYIGSTIRPLKTRIQEHYRNVLKLEAKAPLVEHFQEFHSNDRTFTFCGLQRITLSQRGGNLHLRLRQEESRMIIHYDTVNTGLNKDHEWHYWLL